MKNDMVGKWGHTTNEETYHGWFGTWQEAAREAGKPGETVKVGQYRSPYASGYIDADLVIEHITEQDDYAGDWADGSFDTSGANLEELTEALRETFDRWVETHGLQPQFGIVDASQEVIVPTAGELEEDRCA